MPPKRKNDDGDDFARDSVKESGADLREDASGFGKGGRESRDFDYQKQQSGDDYKEFDHSKTDLS